MKKHYFLLITLFTTTLFFAQNKLSKLDATKTETGIVIPNFSLIDINTYQDNTNSVYSFYQAYKTIAKHDLKSRFQSLETLKSNTKNDRQNNIVSLGILNTEFEVVKPEAFTNGRVALDTDGYLTQNNTSEAIYNKNSLTLLTPLQSKHKGLDVTFQLSQDNIFSNNSKTITGISIDFGDNNGFITVQENQNIAINYSEKGSKTITSILTFADGTSIESKSTINIAYSNQDLASRFGMAPITFSSTNTTAPNLTPYGIANDIGTGEYEIFLSPDNVLDKPIFIVDGFDPGDGRDIVGLYDLLNFDDNGTPSNLGDEVRAEGFDVVVLNFPLYTRASDNVEVDGGADFIERNAMLLVELIGIINAQKIGTEPNVVIGPSMGGLISRYALNFMENQSLNHDTRLWISFDSPHLGANVPIGFQYLFNKIAYGLQVGGLGGDQSVESLRPLVDDFLKSTAARQMLVDHFEAHITSGTDFNNSLMLPQKHPWSDIFYNGLNALTASGFPENVRKVSMINGSGIGSPYPDTNGADINPNFQSLDVQDLAVGSGITASVADFTSNFTASAGQQNEVARIFIDTPFLCFCGNFNASADVQAETFSNGVDAGSGGLFDIGGLTGALGNDPLILGFLAGLTTDYFNFIPSVSGMALQNDGEIDWFHVPNSLVTARTVDNITPFDNWYMPDENEPHVTLTPQNVEFALDEIILSTLGVDTFENNFIKIEKNPFSNFISILSSKTFNDATVSVVDMTGKVVYNSNQTISNQTQINLNVASGIYILSIDTKDDYIFKTKIIKE